MLSVNSKKISGKLLTTKIVNDVVVSLCIKSKLDACSLNTLLNQNDCKCMAKGYEKSAVMFAVYLSILDKLSGNPLAVKNSKVARVDMGYNNGVVIISWKMKGVLSHVRKSLGIAMSAIKPASLYSIYANSVSMLGGKPNRAVFNYSAAEVISDMKHLDVMIVGNVKATEVKLKDLLTTVEKKLALGDASKPQTKSSNDNKCENDSNESSNVVMKLSGWESFLLTDYINTKLKGVKVLTSDDKTTIHMDQNKYKKMKPKLKSGVADFITKKYGKLPDYNVLAYMGLSNTNTGCDDSVKLTKLKTKDIQSSLEKLL